MRYKYPFFGCRSSRHVSSCCCFYFYLLPASDRNKWSGKNINASSLVNHPIYHHETIQPFVASFFLDFFQNRENENNFWGLIHRMNNSWSWLQPRNKPHKQLFLFFSTNHSQHHFILPPSRTNTNSAAGSTVHPHTSQNHDTQTTERWLQTSNQLSATATTHATQKPICNGLIIMWNF